MMKEQIALLMQEKKQYQERITKIENAIKALQALCDHDYIATGSYPHYSIEECTKCAHEIKI